MTSRCVLLIHSHPTGILVTLVTHSKNYRPSCATIPFMTLFELLRIEAGLKREAIARTYGVTKMTVSRWARGISLPRRTDTLFKIERDFGHKADELFAVVR